MKLLKIALEGINLYKDERFEIDFFAAERIVDQGAVHQLRKNIYSQNVVALSGINAVGKTISLQLIQLVYQILAGHPQSLTLIPLADQLQKGFTLKAIFTAGDKLFYLESDIEAVPRERDWLIYPKMYDFRFKEEVLYRLDRDIRTRKQLADFDLFRESATLVKRRSELDNTESLYLLDDRSIVSIYSRQSSAILRSLYGEVANPGAIASTIVQTFDANIDYIVGQADSEQGYRLRFKSDQADRPTDSIELGDLLSSGTIRGTGIIINSIQVLRSGGYFLLDEIESHLNKQLCGVIISLFSAERTNPNGATLVFSTHYPEVLDFIQRKDNVFFLVRGDDFRTEIVKYSDRVKRVEGKKSEVFNSNYIKGTAPRDAEMSALEDYVAGLVRQLV